MENTIICEVFQKVFVGSEFWVLLVLIINLGCYNLEVDEDESSACAPYLARQMSCLGSQTLGVKDTSFLGSAQGAKEAGRRQLPGEPRQDLQSTETQGVYPGSGRPEAKSLTPACLD